MSSTGKHVHFAAKNIFYSPPATPSPTFSDVSLPNSDGPATPPTITATLPATEHGTRIHGVLAFRPDQPPPIMWDVTMRPDTLVFNPALGIAPSHTRHILAEPATSPPLSSLTLLCDQLPYAITVHPGAVFSAESPFTPPTRPLPPLSNTAGSMVATPGMPYVTVHDVLTVLYTTLRLPLMPTEYTQLPPPNRTAVDSAYNLRCGKIVDRRRQEEERRKGIKRVDFVIAAGRTRFCGLGATKKGREIWVLNLG